MSDLATIPDAVDEHRCITCAVLRPNGRPRHFARAAVCEGCREHLRSLLAELVDHYALLPGALAPGQSSEQRVSGSREAPLPLRVDPLDLTLPAPAGRRRWTPMTQPSEQVGYLSTATVLDLWVRDWRDVLDLNEGLPKPTVANLSLWLTNRLDRACADHAAVDEFAGEIRDLARSIRRAVGISEIRPEQLDIPCPRCDLLDLHRLPGEDRVECGSCGVLLTEEEYRRWVKLLAADVQNGVA